MPSDTNAGKKAVALSAARLVEDGMCVGLGTGSTAAFAIAELGRRVRSEGLTVAGVPTSYASELLAREAGIRLQSAGDIDALDLAFDGADEVDSDLNLIKGRGGAHTREKVIASIAREFVVLVDESKVVDRLGSRSPVPVEVLPMALRAVEKAIVRLGGHPELRMGVRKDGPIITDQGFWIIDCRFTSIEETAQLDREIKYIPGVLDHGLFVGYATRVLVGHSDGSVREMLP